MSRLPQLATALLLVSTACGGSGESGTTSSSGGTGNNPSSNAGSAGSVGSAGNASGGSDNGGNGDAGSMGEPDASGSGGATVSDAGAPSTGDAGSAAMGDAGSTCDVMVASHPSEGAQHVAVCSVVSYGTVPPSSGSHYGVWAAFGIYEFALPQGFWVHDLEHGAVVITYNCPQGCDDELAAATAWFNALPVDASCQTQGAIVPRALLLPDPTLDVRFAASAWQRTLRASCFDEAAFTEFYEANVGFGLENVCTSGTDFRGPNGMPAATLPADCGQ